MVTIQKYSKQSGKSFTSSTILPSFMVISRTLKLVPPRSRARNSPVSDLCKRMIRKGLIFVLIRYQDIPSLKRQPKTPCDITKRTELAQEPIPKGKDPFGAQDPTHQEVQECRCFPSEWTLVLNNYLAHVSRR